MRQCRSIQFVKILFFFILSNSYAQPVPWSPILKDRVEQVDGSRYLHPLLPPFRTSEDARIGINNKTVGKSIEFYLFAPEKIKTSFLESDNGPSILATTVPYNLDETTFLGLSFKKYSISHTTICDPTKQFDLSRQRNNPYVCGAGKNKDCYDLELVSVLKRSNQSQEELWQTPITVIVSNPKTQRAKIESIRRRNKSFKGMNLVGVSSFFEPIFAGEDKRLMIGRIAGSRITWTDDSKRKRSGRYDIVYSRSSNQFKPCDTRGFKELYPISHAPYDSAIKNKYGFAKMKFRDTTGKYIADGEEIGGTYPWIDKHANNFVMMGLPGTLYNYDKRSQTVKTRYPTKCVTKNCLRPNTVKEMSEVESSGKTKGYIFTGLWTHGKMVYMDTPIQGVDYGTKGKPEYNRSIELYKGGDNYVRIGLGRDNTSFGLPGYTKNSSFFESSENLYNFNKNFIPRSPRDVVWLISSGARTHEYAFDEHINPDVLIYSPMNAALEKSKTSNTFIHHDGYSSSTHRFSQRIKLQNAATSLKWRIPSVANVIGPGRVEPVSMGGAHAKGFWFQGNTHLEYNIPKQIQNPLTKDWYLGMYLDPRFSDSKRPRTLLEFPNGDKIRLVGLNGLAFVPKKGKYKYLPFSQNLPRRKWTHLGLEITPGGKWIQVFINGFHMNTYTRPTGNAVSFRINSGKLKLGGNFYGWMDEFKVIAGKFNQEEKCNYADGSLLSLKPHYSGPLRSIANKYPSYRHQQIYEKLVANGDTRVNRQQKFVCNVNYNSIAHANTNDIPKNTFSVKHKMLFPEGPLVFDEPRPDSSRNNFCLRCHDTSLKGGLKLSALTPRNYVYQAHDRRRQPMQAPRRMFGVIPGGLLNNSRTLKTTNDGFALDRYMHAFQ